MFASTSLTPKEVLRKYQEEVIENNKVAAAYKQYSGKVEWLQHVETGFYLPSIVVTSGKRIFCDILYDKLNNVFPVVIEEYSYYFYSNNWKLTYAYCWEFPINKQTQKLTLKFLKGYMKHNESR